jgi:ATP-dependent DNA helicase RecQ
LFTDLASIDEETIAKRLAWSRDKVYDQLVELSKERIIHYIPRKKTPFLTFTREREAVERVVLGKEAYDDRRDRYISRVKGVLDYAQEENICRSQMLLSYFGEKDTNPCGCCDTCLRKRDKKMTTDEFESIRRSIEQALTIESLSVNSLVKKLDIKEQKVLQVIRFMLDNGMIEENEIMHLKLK